jgi:hypothetical protein
VDEREAIQRLKREELAGLAHLVSRHQVQAVRAAYLVTRDVDLARELVQAAFVQVCMTASLASMSSDRSDRGLLKSVVNAAVKSATRRGREVAFSAAGDVVDTDFTPEARFERAETGRRGVVCARAADARSTRSDRPAVLPGSE